MSDNTPSKRIRDDASLHVDKRLRDRIKAHAALRGETVRTFAERVLERELELAKQQEVR
jgi:hypothetical protein